MSQVATREIEVLLVDDNAPDVELTVRALRRHNLANHIHVAEDGQEALDFLFCREAYSERSFASPPKVVFLDLKMPKVDGIEVLRRIKADERTKTIPVVMLTSSAQESDIVRSYELGVNSYIVKPVKFDAFLEEVSKAGCYWAVMNKVPYLP
jgi:two-component system response regulator